MNKAALFVFAFVLSFIFIASSASAATELDTKIDKVMGVQYLWAGTSTKGFDCSGFTRYIFAQFDIDLPHSSRTQATEGVKVAKSDLQAGDLIFFNTGGSGISHVGIYVGDGYFVHAANKSGVTKSKLSQAYYAKRYVTSRRLLSDKQYAAIATDIEIKPTVKKDHSDYSKPDQDEPQSSNDQDTDPVINQEESY